jgi:hypothetical protein
MYCITTFTMETLLGKVWEVTLNDFLACSWHTSYPHNHLLYNKRGKHEHFQIQTV